MTELTPRQSGFVEALRAVDDFGIGEVIGQSSAIVSALCALRSHRGVSGKLSEIVARLIVDVNDIAIAAKYLQGERHGAVS